MDNLYIGIDNLSPGIVYIFTRLHSGAYIFIPGVNKYSGKTGTSGYCGAKNKRNLGYKQKPHATSTPLAEKHIPVSIRYLPGKPGSISHLVTGIIPGWLLTFLN